MIKTIGYAAHEEGAELVPIILKDEIFVQTMLRLKFSMLEFAILIYILLKAIGEASLTLSFLAMRLLEKLSKLELM